MSKRVDRSPVRGGGASQGGSVRVGERAFRRRRQMGISREAKQARRRREIRRPAMKTQIDAWVRRVPTFAWICAAIAVTSAVCWAFITPPFQVPDEPAHIAYVTQVAVNDRLPGRSGLMNTEEQVAINGTRSAEIFGQPQLKATATKAENDVLLHNVKVAIALRGQGSDGAGVAGSQPPLYYALEAIPYSLTSGSLLKKLLTMRLFSAIFAAVTAFFAYLFLLEVLVGERWASAVGGMAVALTPILGFMSGSVNPDSMLFAVSAAAFFCLARMFRRGFTRKRAVGLGVVTAIGFLTKLNFIGLAPGILLGLVVLAVRTRGQRRRDTLVSLGIALAVALSPVVVDLAKHVAEGGSAGFVSSSAGGLTGSVGQLLSYVWELYLPRLPGMHHYFAGLSTARVLWFDHYVGQLGWLDTPFPAWVDNLALVPLAAIIVLFTRSLVLNRNGLRARSAEAGVYLVMAVGLMAIIGASSFQRLHYAKAEYAQVRYLIPLIPLVGVVIALAARGAGRRWGPAVGAALVVLFLAHDIFSQLQVVARFYG
jgi:hypothetical protein